MSYRKVFMAVACLVVFLPFCGAQNFSGLQNKKLSRADDIGSMLESLLGRLDKSIDGSIDSVIITQDLPKEMNLRIYYTGYTNCYFSISCLSKARFQESWLDGDRFQQPERNSPAQCQLRMNNQIEEGIVGESPYLRIDITKKPGGSGKVKVFLLQKQWKLDSQASPNLVFIPLVPVGVAATLTETELDITPPKMIYFDPKVKYEIRDNRKGTAIPTNIRDHRSGTGNAYETGFRLPQFDLADNINGTWVNKDINATMARLVISNSNNVSLMSKSTVSGHTRLAETAHGPLTAAGTTQYNSNLTLNDPPAIPTTYFMNLVLSGNDLRVKMTIRIKSNFNWITRNYDYNFQRQVFSTDPIGTIQPVTVITDPIRPVNTDELGPDKNKPGNLWDGIAVDNAVDFGRPQDISNINMTVFPDKNPHSGIWYILPADYHLLWDPESTARNGYGLYISYGTQADGTPESVADASVLVKAVLTAGINSKEKNFVRSLLRVKDPEFKDIKYLPLRENIQSTFQATLGAQYNIPPEKITVTSSTDLENTVTVAWRTNPDTKEFIQTALTSGEGIVASMILRPKEQEIVDQQIDAIISLSNTCTLGKMELDPLTWRTKDWINPTAYTLKLKYFHVMKKSKQNNRPIIYTWSIDKAEVASRGHVSFDNSKVPKWLDNDPTSVMWLSYTVNDCDSCNADLITGLTGGVSGNTVQQIRFVIPDQVFDSLKASYFVITVRSAQGDPKHEKMIELPVVNITKEPGKNFTAGPLFIPNNGMPDFEYNIKIASTDGDFYRSDKWIRSNEKNVFLGKSDLKELFRGIIPGIN